MFSRARALARGRRFSVLANTLWDPGGPAAGGPRLLIHPLPANLNRISINADDYCLLASLDTSLQLVVAWCAQ